MPRNWHVVNARDCPEVVYTRTRAGKIFFYKADELQVPIAFTYAPVPYRLCRMDGSDVVPKPLPNILACQLALRDRL